MFLSKLQALSIGLPLFDDSHNMFDPILDLRLNSIHFFLHDYPLYNEKMVLLESSLGAKDTRGDQPPAANLGGERGSDPRSSIPKISV